MHLAGFVSWIDFFIFSWAALYFIMVFFVFFIAAAVKNEILDKWEHHSNKQKVGEERGENPKILMKMHIS